MWKTALFLLLFPVAVFAQNSEIEIGVKVGVNARNVLYSSNVPLDNSAQNFVPGFSLGLFMYKKINDQLLIQGEALYQEKGFRYNDRFNLPGRIDIRYFSVPVVARYRVVGRNWVEVGPEIGIRQKALSTTAGKQSDVTGFYRQRLDLSLVAGIAVNPSDSWWGGLRVMQGMNSVIGGAGSLNDPYLRARHTVVQLWVGYILPK